MALTQTEVSQLYVSIFGRASEGEGNTYWQTDQEDMVSTANTMLDTDAAQEYFGDTLDDNEAFIEFIYENTLGKTIEDDPEGIAYWVAELEGGKSKGEVVVALITAAQSEENAGDAQDQFVNKVTVSNYTADNISTVTDIDDFAGYIAGVTHEAATVTAAEEAIDEDIPAVPGETFVLTTGIDTVVGTDDDDVIQGIVDTRNDISTLNNQDSIDGGAGNDTLKVIMDRNQGDVGYAGTATVTNVETVDVAIGSNAAMDFNTANFTDLETVQTSQSIATVTFNNIQSADIELVVKDTQVGANANYMASALAGDDDQVNVTVEDVTNGNIQVGAQGGSTAAASVETIALTSQGVLTTNTINSITEQGGFATTLTVDGTNNLTINTALNANIATVDAATLEGGLTATVQANRATINGGLGDDVITYTGAVPGSTIDLGTGDDLLGINSQNVDLGDAAISNVETLQIEDNTAVFTNHDVNFADFTVDKVQIIDAVGVAAAGVLTLSDYDNAVPLALMEDYAGTVTVVKDGDSDTNADTLSVSMEGDRDAQNGVVGAILNISDVETLNIDSSQTNMQAGNIFNNTGDISTLAVNDASTELESVVLTGTGTNTSIDLNGFDADLKTIDASEMTGNLSVDISDAAADIAYTGALGDNLIEFGTFLTSKDSITTGEGADEIRADLGATAVTLDSDGVETVSVLSTNNAARLNLQNATGLTDVIVEDSILDLTLDNLAEGVSITLEDGGFAATDLTIIGAQKELSIDILDMDDVNDTTGTINVGSKVETLSLSFADSDTTTTQTITALESTSLKTLNLSVSRGDDLVITGILGSDGNAATVTDLTPALTTINGADSKGGITLTVNNIAGTVTTGLADDTITLAQALDNTMTVNAGEQDVADTIIFSAGDNVSAADMANISGFETFNAAGALTLSMTSAAVASAESQTVTINGNALGALVLNLSALTADQSADVTGLNAGDTITIGTGADTVDLTAAGGTIVITNVDYMSSDTLTGADAVASSTLKFTDGIDRDTAIDISNVEGFDTMLLTGTQQEYKLVLTNDLLNDSGAGYVNETLTVDASDSFILNLDASKVKDATVLTATYAANSYDINVIGSDNNDIIKGTANADTLDGGAGNDYLTGNAGNDIITGGGGIDTLTGSAGIDTFTYAAATDSVAGAFDTITDFTSGTDIVDLSAVLGGGAVVPGALTAAIGALDGTAAEFGGNAIAYHDDGTDTTVYVDVDGSGALNAGDMVIELAGVTGAALVVADFLV